MEKNHLKNFNLKKEKAKLRSLADKLCYEIYLKPNCEICNKKAQQLHHFYPKSCYNYLRYCSENLISLCLGCHFRLTHQDKRLEDKIREKRGEKWYKKLSKMAQNRPKGSYLTTEWYEKQIQKLHKISSL